MMGRLHVDFFFQDRNLLHGVEVKVRLMQSKDAFALMAGGDQPDYKIHIVEAASFARKAKLNPVVQMGHIKALEKGGKCWLRPGNQNSMDPLVSIDATGRCSIY